jgi:hypothetical protein
MNFNIITKYIFFINFAHNKKYIILLHIYFKVKQYYTLSIYNPNFIYYKF